MGEHRIAYQFIDIDQDIEAQEYVKQQNNNKQIIPTIVFADGSILVEPTNAELADKLGLQTRAKRQFYDLIIAGAGLSEMGDNFADNRLNMPDPVFSGTSYAENDVAGAGINVLLEAFSTLLRRP